MINLRLFQKGQHECFGLDEIITSKAVNGRTLTVQCIQNDSEAYFLKTVDLTHCINMFRLENQIVNYMTGYRKRLQQRLKQTLNLRHDFIEESNLELRKYSASIDMTRPQLNALDISPRKGNKEDFFKQEFEVENYQPEQNDID